MAIPTTARIRILNSIKWTWKGTQNIVGWLGLIIASNSLYLQTLGKEHDLHIILSSIDPGGEKITFGVIYNNTGDYTETITDASASLQENIDSNMAWADFMEDCFAPVTVKPGDTVHRFYTVHLPYHGLERTQNMEGEIESQLAISHTVLMPNGGSKRFELMAGKIVHRATGKAISSVEIKNNFQKINFIDGGKGLGSISLPDNRTSPTCVQKRHNTTS
ncbi:hypothetical protein OH710_02775 [Pseudomonas capsici]|uniref:hypothetical protein n=1 Tax=Pseudomonas capsici TaxID=2810614 RepID=UPI0019106286|nr:hypothetical protein [Pseudomonas capsici]MBX8612685.1 hypothetical protein [Pseudomonas cichorii]MCV4271554.1 hypothetical protein [Pseudomonas capsici]GFM69520.1 hypothetical protein PSCICL_05120 [Pseudomonas cichorii]